MTHTLPRAPQTPTITTAMIRRAPFAVWDGNLITALDELHVAASMAKFDKADGHTKGIPRNTGDGNGVRKSINARFANTGHPHQITEDKIKSTLAGGASLDCVQIMEITGQNLEVTRRGLRRMELAGAVSVIRVGPSSKKVFTLVRRAGRKTGGAV